MRLGTLVESFSTIKKFSIPETSMNPSVNPKNLDRKESDNTRHSWQEAFDRAERKHQGLKKKIRATPGTGRVLQKLTRAGANKQTFLSLLKSEVRGGRFWVAPVRQKKKGL